MEVPALLSKLDELNREGQQVQKEINSVDEQLAKTDLDLTMISQEIVQLNKNKEEIQLDDRSTLNSIQVMIELKRAMLSSLDKQIQLEEEEILKLFNQLEQSIVAIQQVTKEGIENREKSHLLTVQRINQEKEKFSQRIAELNRSVWNVPISVTVDCSPKENRERPQ